MSPITPPESSLAGAAGTEAGGTNACSNAAGAGGTGTAGAGGGTMVPCACIAGSTGLAGAGVGGTGIATGGSMGSDFATSGTTGSGMGLAASGVGSGLISGKAGAAGMGATGVGSDKFNPAGAGASAIGNAGASGAFASGVFSGAGCGAAAGGVGLVCGAGNSPDQCAVARSSGVGCGLAGSAGAAGLDAAFTVRGFFAGASTAAPGGGFSFDIRRTTPLRQSRRFRCNGSCCWCRIYRTAHFFHRCRRRCGHGLRCRMLGRLTQRLDHIGMDFDAGRKAARLRVCLSECGAYHAETESRACQPLHPHGAHIGAALCPYAGRW